MVGKKPQKTTTTTTTKTRTVTRTRETIIIICVHILQNMQSFDTRYFFPPPPALSHILILCVCEIERRGERENSNTKTLFYKDCTFCSLERERCLPCGLHKGQTNGFKLYFSKLLRGTRERETESAIGLSIE